MLASSFACCRRVPPINLIILKQQEINIFIASIERSWTAARQFSFISSLNSGCDCCRLLRLNAIKLIQVRVRRKMRSEYSIRLLALVVVIVANGRDGAYHVHGMVANHRHRQHGEFSTLQVYFFPSNHVPLIISLFSSFAENRKHLYFRRISRTKIHTFEQQFPMKIVSLESRKMLFNLFIKCYFRFFACCCCEPLLRGCFCLRITGCRVRWNASIATID